VDNKLRELLAARNAKWDAAEDKGEHVDTRDPEQVALMAAAAKRARRATRPQGGSAPKPAPPAARKPDPTPHCTRGRGGHRQHTHGSRVRFAPCRGLTMLGAMAVLASVAACPSIPYVPAPPPGKDRR